MYLIYVDNSSLWLKLVSFLEEFFIQYEAVKDYLDY